MQRRVQRDFTQGSIPWHLVLFSIPMFLGSVLQALYSTVDSIWVGRFLGPKALGAVSISFPIFMAMLSLVIGLSMAATTLVSQYRGARDETRVRQTIATAFLLVGVLGALATILGYFGRHWLIGLVAPPAELRAMAEDYFGIIMAGVLGLFLYNLIAAILRGVGDSATPLKALAVATVLNIVLDPIFIFGVGPIPEMGVSGAALATILSQGLSAGLLYWWMHRGTDLLPRSRTDWRVNLELLAQLLRVGLPSGIQQMVASFGMVVVFKIIASFGADVVAAFGAASRLDQFGWMPAMAIGMSISAVVGQNLGAGKVDRAKKAVLWSLLLAGGLTSLISLVAFFRPTVLMVLFTSDPGVLVEGSLYLRFASASYVIMAMLFVLGGALRGAGDTIVPMILSIAMLWVFRVPMVWYFAGRLGIRGVWLGILVSALVGLVLQGGYYLTGRWRRYVLARPPGAEAARGADADSGGGPEALDAGPHTPAARLAETADEGGAADAGPGSVR